MRDRVKHGAALLTAVLTAADLGAQTTINFEGLGSMANAEGVPVPASAQLSSAFLGQGVRFSSGSAFVAVLNLGAGHATSGVLGVAGTTAAGNSSYSVPIIIEFFNPALSAQLATTNTVSIRSDLSGSGAPITLNAFDVFGALLGSSTLADLGGPTLSVTAPGIHRVEVIGNGSSAFDDLQFGPLTAVSAIPEPGTLALLGTGFLGLGGMMVRRKRGT
jgi:hypothetical protein